MTPDLTKTDDFPHILIPLPDHDFDPSESSLPWQECMRRGWKVSFSTEFGKVAAADHRLLMGPIRGPLGSGKKARDAYQSMTQTVAYQNPIPYAEIDSSQFDALHLTGGHAPGMCQFLDSTVLQSKAVEFWQGGKVIGAMCHGVLILARALDPETGRSILSGTKVTALTKNLERTGYYMTFWLLGKRYRTYPCFVEDEVKGCLDDAQDFDGGRSMFIPHIVEDGNLITSRWPGDAPTYARRFAEKVANHVRRKVLL